MSITFHDPRAEPGAPIESYDARLRVDDRPLSIGFLANGFPDSVNFLHCVETSMLKRLPVGTATVFLNKGNASAPATAAQLDGMAAEVHAVVTAYGH
jgi:hypothetical protein